MDDSKQLRDERDQADERCEADAPVGGATGGEEMQGGFEEGQSPVKALYYVINKHPLNREIFYKILRACMSPQLLSELEGEVAAFPEFQSAMQSPFWYINRLVEFGGLDQTDVDESGEAITAGRAEALSEEEIEELVVDSMLVTTEAGGQIVEEFSPKKRLAELFRQMPARKEAFIEVLEYCEDQARPYSSICNLLKGRPVLEFSAEHPRGIQPSVFVDFLEKSSVIVWGNEGWTLSKEGRGILRDLREMQGAK